MDDCWLYRALVGMQFSVHGMFMAYCKDFSKNKSTYSDGLSKVDRTPVKGFSNECKLTATVIPI